MAASVSTGEPGVSILRRPNEEQCEGDALLPKKSPRRVSYGVNTTVSVSSSNDDSENSKSDTSTGSFGLNPQQWKTLLTILVATLTSSFAVCLFPPFFPRLAEEKGCNAATYGFIIGTNCLTSFIVTPFIGKNVSKSIFTVHQKIDWIIFSSLNLVSFTRW